MSFFNQSPGPAQGTSQQPYNNQQQGFNNNQGSQYIWQSTSQQPQYGQQQGGGFNQSQGTWQMNGMQYGQQMQQQQPWQGNMSNGPSPFGSSMFGQQPGPGLSNSASEKKNYLPGYLSSVGTVSAIGSAYTFVLTRLSRRRMLHLNKLAALALPSDHLHNNAKTQVQMIQWIGIALLRL